MATCSRCPQISAGALAGRAVVGRDLRAAALARRREVAMSGHRVGTVRFVTSAPRPRRRLEP